MFLLEVVLTRLKRATRFLINEGINVPSMVFLWGAVLEEAGRLDRAAAVYQRALDLADRSRDRRMFKVRQRWQFRLERLWHLRGNPRVHDPLFACGLQPRHDRAAGPAAGGFRAQWEARGLRIDGFLFPLGRSRTIEVRIDDMVVRTIPLTRVAFLPPFFQITLTRATIEAFPPRSTLRLVAEDGSGLAWGGAQDVEVVVPHGDGSLGSHGPADRAVDKKGTLIGPQAEMEARRARLLDLYARARDAFDQHAGSPLMLMYGTLLGFHRGGDFIVDDDDFDVGYFSDAVSVDEVKREGMALVEKLAAAGFWVSFNRVGRLFRLRSPDDPPEIHLDVHAMWREHGALWIHPKARLACTREDFLPCAQARFRGVQVNLPARPEAFLAGYYGPGWRTPDPAYSTNSRPFSYAWRRYLARAFVTPTEYAGMRERIAAAAPGGPGRLISIGSHSLYPLDVYNRECE